MNIISASALKEAFYMQFYLDYKNFLNINMGVERLSNGLLKAKTDIYSKTLYKYGVFDKEKKKLDMGVVREYLKEDKRISGSIEDFFCIIAKDEDALEYIASLMQYIKNATTAVEGGWLAVEDHINMLILKHFWGMRIEEGSLESDGSLKYERDENGMKQQYSIKYDELSSSKVTEYNIIGFLKQLPGVESNNKEFFLNRLNKSRILRNKFAHKKLLPDNFADAVVIARYKLYSYLAATLCLRIKEPVMETRFVVKNSAENQDAHLRVWEVAEGKPDEELTVEKVNYGWECSLKRFHAYKLEVSGIDQTMNLKLDWFSLTPSGEYDGIKLTLYDNDFEKVVHNPGATLSDVVQMNERIANILRIIEAKQDSGNKSLVNIEKSLSQLSKEILEVSVELTNQTKELHNSFSKLVKNADEIAEELQRIRSDFGKFLPLLQGIKNDFKKSVVLLGVLVFFVIIFGSIVLLHKTKSQEQVEVECRTPEEWVAIGDSLFGELLQNYTSWTMFIELANQTGDAYRFAIDAYRRMVFSNNNDTTACIKLAQIYLRGKGKCSLDSAFYFAQLAQATPQGNGMLAYLYFCKGLFKEAKEQILAKTLSADDNNEYLQLTKMLFKLYEIHEKDSASVANLCDSIARIPLQEAKEWIASVRWRGIVMLDEDRLSFDSFVTKPNLAEGYKELINLVYDSISVHSLAELGNIHLMLNNRDQYLLFTYPACVCGISELAGPLLASLIEHGNSDGETQKLMRRLNEITKNNPDSVGTTWVEFRNLSNKYSSFDDNTILGMASKRVDKLLNNASTFSNLEFSRDELKRMQVSILLSDGNNDEALKLAMEYEGIDDTLAVEMYLQAVCLAKGYSGCVRDIKKSDSLIALSAERNYPEAVFTRIKRSRAPEHITIKDEWYEPSYSSSLKFVEFHTPELPDIPSIVWKNSPKVAAALIEYWLDTYTGNNIGECPYVDYSPLECQTLYNVYRIWENLGFDAVLESGDIVHGNNKIGNEIKKELMDKLRTSITIAMIDKQPRVAKYFCYVYMMLAQQSSDPYGDFMLYAFLLNPQQPGETPSTLMGRSAPSKWAGKTVELLHGLDYPTYAY